MRVTTAARSVHESAPLIRWRRFAPRVLAPRIGRALFSWLRTIQGLGAFSLISLGVLVRKYDTAGQVLRPLLRREIARAGSRLLPMFLFMAAALGLVVITWILGQPILLFLAGLEAIPPELTEAAHIDGAVGWTHFRRITLPLLRPTLLFVLVTQTIAVLQTAVVVILMTRGGPANATQTIGLVAGAGINCPRGRASAPVPPRSQIHRGQTATPRS